MSVMMKNTRQYSSNRSMLKLRQHIKPVKNKIRGSRQTQDINRKQLGCTYSRSLFINIVIMMTNLGAGFKSFAVLSCSTDKEDAGSL